ncbi:hypothetical protein ACFVYR_24145 [Streptomyces sp. NPDC058284]|uniref:hypothetical protein n=1 Tax=unclassified Streptomyces TaxID=2593676 RepID=UPI003662A15C
MPAVAALAVAALWGVAGCPGQAGAAAGTPRPYAFAADAETVEGAMNNVEGPRLTPGKTYKSTLPRVGQRFYRLELKARDSAYVSVTAVPKPGSQVSYADGVEVSVQDADGNNCSPMETEEARFGSSESPRPITATAVRRVGPDERTCAQAGTYYVLVERARASGSVRRSVQEDWDLELHVASEPALRTGSASEPPRTWDSATPVPPSGERRTREGGTSFSTARGLAKGVWGSGIEPGETLFYRVPVDWGQQISVAAELGSTNGVGAKRDGAGSGAGATESGSDRTGRGLGRSAGYVSSALVMSLSNPVRAEAGDADTAYDGRQKSVALDPLPPVAYENRFALADKVSAMRFAGWYYLSVHLSPQVAERFGDAPLELTLRVDVDGSPQPGPAYAGSPVPAEDFGVTERDTEAAKRGETAVGSGADAETDGLLVVVAAGGIGGGAVLLGVLGMWTLIGRRRASAAVAAAASAGAGAGASAGPGAGTGTGAGAGAGGADAPESVEFGPSRGW